MKTLCTLTQREINSYEDAKWIATTQIGLTFTGLKITSSHQTHGHYRVKFSNGSVTLLAAAQRNTDGTYNVTEACLPAILMAHVFGGYFGNKHESQDIPVWTLKRG